MRLNRVYSTGAELIAVSFISLVLFFTAFFSSGGVTVVHLWVFAVASTAMRLCQGGAGHLHNALLDPVLPHPVASYAALIVLFFLAGGVGFTTTMLAAKMYGVIPVRDIPISNIFHAGGAAGLLMAASREAARRVLSGKPADE